MNTVKCPKCGQENKNTNIRCEFCCTELNHIDQSENFLNKDYSQTNIKTIDLGSKTANYIINAILIFMFAPCLFIGLVLIGVSSYSNITDYNKAKNYLEIEGKLVDYENCEYDDDGSESCDAIYEYIVNGVTYKGSPNISSNRSGFKQTTTVKYNPNNPSECVISFNLNILLIVGIIIVTVVLAIFISVNIFIKKYQKKANDNEKDKPVFNT